MSMLTRAATTAVMCAVVGFVAPPVFAQATGTATSDPVMAKLVGRWEGTGTILGQPAQVRMEWAPVLADRFVRLTFESHIGAPPQARRFEGQAYYRASGEATFMATWFDSAGRIRPITAVRARTPSCPRGARRRPRSARRRIGWSATIVSS